MIAKYYRQPTSYEIKFGEGAIHHLEIPITVEMVNRDSLLKRRIYHQGLCYTLNGEPREIEVLPVVFRKFKDGQIIALFPTMLGSHHRVQTYMHFGQHCEADYKECISKTKPAFPGEYKELKTEIENHPAYRDTILKVKEKSKVKYQNN